MSFVGWLADVNPNQDGSDSWMFNNTTSSRPLSIALLGLIVLAGCLGGVGPTSSSGPPDADWTVEDGLNTTALAENHFRSIREAGSFTVNHSETIRVGGDASPEAPRPEGYHPPTFARQQVNLDEGRYHDTFVTVDHRRSNHFITPDVTASRQKECPDCNYEYRYQERPESDTLSERIDRYRSEETVENLASFLRGVSVGFNYSYDGTVTRSGETLHRYQAEQTLDSSPPPFAEPPTGTATILVTADGVITEFTLQYAGQATVTDNGQTQTVNVTHTFKRTYTAIGETSIDQPPWVDQAAEESSTRTTETGEQ